jgi:hypothetical protein
MIFKRLSQYFQSALSEFRQFVEEQHTTVSQADLAWAWPAPSAD